MDLDHFKILEKNSSLFNIYVEIVNIISTNRCNPDRTDLMKQFSIVSGPVAKMILNKYNQIKGRECETSADRCPICLDSLLLSPTVIPNCCDHIYHEKCWTRWALINPKCALCIQYANI